MSCVSLDSVSSVPEIWHKCHFLMAIFSCSTNGVDSLVSGNLSMISFDKYNSQDKHYDKEVIKITDKDTLTRLKEELKKAKGQKGKIKMARNADYIVKLYFNEGRKESFNLWFDNTMTFSLKRENDYYIYELPKEESNNIASILEN